MVRNIACNVSGPLESISSMANVIVTGSFIKRPFEAGRMWLHRIDCTLQFHFSEIVAESLHSP